MLFRQLSRRDAFLVLLGAASMHLWTLFHQGLAFQSSSITIVTPDISHAHTADIAEQIPIGMHAAVESVLPPANEPEPPAAHNWGSKGRKHKNIIQAQQKAQVPHSPPLDALSSPSSSSSESTTFSSTPLTPAGALPPTSLVAHAPGWTIFRNLYMSNGTLFILGEKEAFPEVRMMVSTPLEAFNTPENIAAREPSKEVMDFMGAGEARRMWGAEGEGEENRVWTIEGNTLLFNDPPQFLKHYYHFVAELFLGVQAFWHSAFFPSAPSSSPTTHLSPSTHYSSVHPPPPPIHRAIFLHSPPSGWRDHPGFNSYFLRGAFPSLSVEHAADWADRTAATSSGTRAFLFPLALVTDRSAAHRGLVCGTQTQRTAAEAWSWAHNAGRLRGMHVGGWWAPVRSALWRFAGAVPVAQTPIAPTPAALALEDVGVDAQRVLGSPETVVVSYISRQGVDKRRLTEEAHGGLVSALREMVERRNGKDGEKWELQVLQAEKMSKDEQVKAAARSTILLGVHGNGLTHLVFMPPTRASTVIEIFYPGGFAHDYHWTARALGMAHFAVWNDTHHSYPNKPEVNYPEGFQGTAIPVHGPTVAQLIEDRVDGKL